MPVVAPPAQAQTYKVLYAFSGGQDGSGPFAGLTMDSAGNLYGTTDQGGNIGGNCKFGCGTVFKLTHKGSGWVFTPLYLFQGGSDGSYPEGKVISGPDGSLYGTTWAGGGSTCQGVGYQGCGTIFNLKPPPAACKTALCPWTETVLYRFQGSGNPQGDLVFDKQGNLYGGSVDGIYELSPSGGGWTLNYISSMVSWSLIFDKAGNLYGAGLSIFELTPSPSGWVVTVLYTFTSDDGYGPTRLTFDKAGNLYGGLCCNSNWMMNGASGAVFELSSASGGWSYSTLYSFYNEYQANQGPYNGSLVFDPEGNLYGTTIGDPAGYGNVFRLTPSGGSWTYTDLHDFVHGSGGAGPNNGLVLDANGNLYGTTIGGFDNAGVVFELTP
jgi:hypothetical protein